MHNHIIARRIGIPCFAHLIYLFTSRLNTQVVSRIQNKFFTALQGAYDSAQDWCFRHPKLTLGAGVGAVALAVVLFL